MKKILLLSFMLLLTLSFNALAQDRTVSGTVTSADDGSGLPGVNVILKGTSIGTITDIDGKFQVTVPSEGAILQFSFIGLKTIEVEVGARSVIDVAMAEDVDVLEEVVVSGYQSVIQAKSSISSSTVSAKTIENRFSGNTINALQGQVAGVNIQNTSGQPGSTPSIRIRGTGSINGDTEPLFIIDGTPVNQDNFRSLNPNDIASISVLKDAAGTAIYGNRGANGVVVIKTKSGKKGQPLSVNYTGTYSISELQPDNYNLLSGPEQLRVERALGIGVGGGIINPADGFPNNGQRIDNLPFWAQELIDPATLPRRLTEEEIALAPTTNWLETFFRQAAAQNHNVTLSGGGENNTYFIGLGYLNQQGILAQSRLTRYNTRFNLGGSAFNDKFTYQTNITLNFSENNTPNAIGTGGINQNPVLAAQQAVPYLERRDYTTGRDLTTPLLFRETPLFILDLFETLTTQDDEIKFVGSINLGYKITDDLRIGYTISGDFQNSNTINARDPESFNAILFAENGNNTPGRTFQQTRQETAINSTVNLTYSKTFGEHTVSGSVFQEYYQAYLNTFGFQARGLNQATFFPGDGDAFIPDNPNNDFFVDDANANLLSVALHSYFATASYDFRGKYGFAGTIRRDASSRFSSENDNNIGYFGSVSGFWNAHEESFISGINAIETLKLRGSWGRTGNQFIAGGTTFAGPDVFLDLFTTGAGFGAQNSLFVSQVGSRLARWEVSNQVDVGIDAEFFKGKLSVILDGYIKTTDDLFAFIPVSSINGVTGLNANSGSLRNSGLDWSLTYNILQATNPNQPSLSVRVVGNWNEEEILELPGGVDEIVGIGRVGGKLGEYFQVQYVGVNPSNGNQLFRTAAGEITENPDVDTDRVWLGTDFTPEVNGSVSIDVSWKGFFGSIQGNYVLGVDRFDTDFNTLVQPNSVGQFRSSADITTAWRPDNTVTAIPSLTATNLNVFGTRFLTSADYFRLRFVQVGYNLPTNLLSKVGIKSASVFVNAENLVTFTPWRGFDAELFTNGSRQFPTPRTFVIGGSFNF